MKSKWKTSRQSIKIKEEIDNLTTKQFNDIKKLYKGKITEAENKYKLTENKYLLYSNEKENKKKINEV